MNINKNSWHFKLNMWFKSGNIWKIPTSLCPYFWTTVMHIFLIVIAVLFVCSLGFMFGAPLLMNTGLVVFLGITSVFWQYVVATVLGIVSTAAFIAFLAFVAFSIIYGGHHLQLMYSDYKTRKGDEREAAGLPRYKEPNILIAFIKARKEKLCPHLNFVEGEK